MPLGFERCTHFKVGECRAVDGLGRLSKFDSLVLDSSSLGLLRDALLHVARRLPDL